jgi:hypothetical protein
MLLLALDENFNASLKTTPYLYHGQTQYVGGYLKIWENPALSHSVSEHIMLVGRQ